MGMLIIMISLLIDAYTRVNTRMASAPLSLFTTLMKLTSMMKILLSLSKVSSFFFWIHTKKAHLFYTSLDWYHEQSNTNLASFMSVYNPTGAEPVPRK